MSSNSGPTQNNDDSNTLISKSQRVIRWLRNGKMKGEKDKMVAVTGNTMSTELATRSEESLAVLSVFDRVDPMDFIDKMGKAFAKCGAGGCKNDNDGMVMALACLSQKKDIFEISRQYHLIEGKLVTKSEEMLSRFKKSGGSVEWLKNGTDCREAHLKLSKDGTTVDYLFSIETAKNAGYIKTGSQWAKRPDQMLRARCITDLIRMQWPEISGGDYTEEEVLDIIETTATPKTNGTGRTKVDVEKRAAELKAIENGVSAVVTSPVVENVVDAEVESSITSSASTASTEQPPFDTATSTTTATASESQTGDANESMLDSSADHSFQAAVLEIESLIGQCRMTNEKVLSTYNNQFKTSHVEFGQFSEEHQATILGKLRGVKEKIDRGELVIKDGVLMKA